VVARGGVEPPTFRFSEVWIIVRRIPLTSANVTLGPDRGRRRSLLFRGRRQHPATTCWLSRAEPYPRVQVRGRSWSSVAVDVTTDVGAEGLGRGHGLGLSIAYEQVADVPAQLAARARLLDSGHARKTDALDAASVAAGRDAHRLGFARCEPRISPASSTTARCSRELRERR
jgi:hypothetical protein